MSNGSSLCKLHARLILTSNVQNWSAAHLHVVAVRKTRKRNSNSAPKNLIQRQRRSLSIIHQDYVTGKSFFSDALTCFQCGDSSITGECVTDTATMEAEFYDYNTSLSNGESQDDDYKYIKHCSGEDNACIIERIEEQGMISTFCIKICKSCLNSQEQVPFQKAMDFSFIFSTFLSSVATSLQYLRIEFSYVMPELAVTTQTFLYRARLLKIWLLGHGRLPYR